MQPYHPPYNFYASNPLPVRPVVAMPAQNSDFELLMNLGFTTEQVYESMQAFPGNVNEAGAYLLDKYLQASKFEAAPRQSPEVHVSVNVPPVFKKLHKKHNTCDVTLLVGEEKKAIRAHKYILAIYSSVFDAMFYSEVGMMESVESPILSDVSPEDFENFLQYCYQGAVPRNNIAASLNLYTFADKYMVEGLKEALTPTINELITKENALTIYYYTKEPLFSGFRRAAESCICENALQIFSELNLFNKIEKPLAIELMSLSLKAPHTILLDRVIERVLNNVADADRTKEGLKRLRKTEADLLATVKLEKLDKEGLQIALQSGLFEKDRIIKAMLISGNSQ
eukprot:TRINITY_DN3205_c0_g6_i1.p1 TRINITY_DN3205_c0_g6~~TRINITY_DN3205_c0_g6_i1.p1  ORF type:complete len:340 (-),score=103.70 TRINITY_DN3205_c0_g6_i1:110-1129(-)